MQIKKMAVSSLKTATYNPKGRANDKSRGFGLLKKSIENIGLIYPIVVTKAGRVIDGHRRLQCYKDLGLEQIPVIVVANDDPEHVYAEVNAHSYQLNGNQSLQVYLANPAAVTATARAKFERIESHLGRSILQRASRGGHSTLVIRRAYEISRYVDNDNVAFVRKAVTWLMKWRNQAIVNSYIRFQQSPKSLFNAIAKGHELRPSYVGK